MNHFNGTYIDGRGERSGRKVNTRSGLKRGRLVKWSILVSVLFQVLFIADTVVELKGFYSVPVGMLLPPLFAVCNRMNCALVGGGGYYCSTFDGTIGVRQIFCFNAIGNNRGGSAKGKDKAKWQHETVRVWEDYYYSYNWADVVMQGYAYFAADPYVLVA